MGDKVAPERPETPQSEDAGASKEPEEPGTEVPPKKDDASGASKSIKDAEKSDENLDRSTPELTTQNSSSEIVKKKSSLTEIGSMKSMENTTRALDEKVINERLKNLGKQNASGAKGWGKLRIHTAALKDIGKEITKAAGDTLAVIDDLDLSPQKKKVTRQWTQLIKDITAKKARQNKAVIDIKMFKSAVHLENVSFDLFEIRETDPAQITETQKYQTVATVDEIEDLTWFAATFIRKDGWCLRQSNSMIPDRFFALSFVLTWWNLWFITLYIGFGRILDRTLAMKIIDVTCETVYFTGVCCLPLRTSIVNLEDGREFIDCQFVWTRVCSTRSFQISWISLLSNIWWYEPEDPDAFFMGRYWMYFGLLRLLRIPGALRWKAKKVVDRASASVILQSVAINLTLELFFVTHLFAVVWFPALYKRDGIQTYGLDIENTGWLSYYLMSIRDCVLLLAGSPPEIMNTGRDLSLAIIVSLASPISIIVIAIVLADIVLIKQSWNILATRMIDEKALVNATMNALGLPELLQSRINEYQRFVDLQFGNESARNNLYCRMNALLELETKIFLFSGLIERAPFFADIHAWGIAEIIANFVEEFYSPGDFIVRFGQEGREMYFILKGRCEVLVRDTEGGRKSALHGTTSKKLITVKKAGDYFGEVALVKSGAIRTAYVRAQAYCVLEKLHGHVLHSVVRQKFPDAYTQIVQRMMTFSNVKPDDPSLMQAHFSEPEAAKR